MDTKYQGWTNYETWAIKLWIDNDEGSQNYWMESARDVYKHATTESGLNKKERAALTLSMALKEAFEDDCPELENGPYSDLLNAALGSVNWYEIALSLLAEENEVR